MAAAFRATRAGVGTDAAMLVLVGMTSALAGAGAAEGDASRQLGFQRLPVSGLVGARHDTAGGSANRGAIQIEPDAGDQGFDVLFRQAGVGAGGAGLQAERAGVDACSNGIGVSRMFGMGSEHGAHDGHGVSFSACLGPLSRWGTTMTKVGSAHFRVP